MFRDLFTGIIALLIIVTLLIHIGYTPEQLQTIFHDALNATKPMIKDLFDFITTLGGSTSSSTGS